MPREYNVDAIPGANYVVCDPIDNGFSCDIHSSKSSEKELGNIIGERVVFKGFLVDVLSDKRIFANNLENTDVECSYFSDSRQIIQCKPVGEILR